MHFCIFFDVKSSQIQCLQWFLRRLLLLWLTALNLSLHKIICHWIKYNLTLNLYFTGILFLLYRSDSTNIQYIFILCYFLFWLIIANEFMINIFGWLFLIGNWFYIFLEIVVLVINYYSILFLFAVSTFVFVKFYLRFLILNSQICRYYIGLLVVLWVCFFCLMNTLFLLVFWMDCLFLIHFSPPFRHIFNLWIRPLWKL